MLLIDQDTAEPYLRQRLWIPTDEPVRIRELAGGVSNVVLYIEPLEPGLSKTGPFVVKQARSQLRVAAPWYCSVERIWREVEVLRICTELLARTPAEPRTCTIGIPEVLHEDRDNYAFAMTAAPVGHSVWKELLLGGDYRTQIATACGRLLGDLHAGSWRCPRVAQTLNDRTFFHDLRLDPYYGRIAHVHESLRGPIQRLIDSVWEHRLALVHGDFSPKNLLVFPGGVMLIDFEVGHFGDPAFDLGFFLTHLLLKAIRDSDRFNQVWALIDAFWHAYRARLASTVADEELAGLTARTIQNLAGCALARIDGKSPVDYLKDRDRDTVRRISRALFTHEPADWPAARALIAATRAS